MGNDFQLQGRVVRVEPDGAVELVSGERRVEVLCRSHDNAHELTPGDLVRVRGQVRSGGQLHATELERLGGAAVDPFPSAQSDWYRLHKQGRRVYRALHSRAHIMAAVRGFFAAEGFLEVETPIVVSSPGLELHLDAVEAKLSPGPGAPVRSCWLITSPEYHMKRLLSAGMENIYQITRSFRSAESGVHHNPEFSMLEWYRGFSGWEAIVDDVERLVSAVAMELHGAVRWQWRGGLIDVSTPWERMTVREAIVRYAGFDPYPWNDFPPLAARARAAGLQLDARDRAPEDVLIRALVERVEPALPRDRPLVLTHYPDCMASLARRDPENQDVVERFEVYLGGIELCNGFGELTDPHEQRRRLEADWATRGRMGLTQYPIDEEFLSALEHGVPPSGGVALGVDRLTMVMLDAASVADVLAFPFPRA